MEQYTNFSKLVNTASSLCYCDSCEVTERKRGDSGVTKARRLICGYLFFVEKLSCPKIAKMLNFYGHRGVMHHTKEHKNQLETDARYKALYQKICDEMNVN